MAITTTYQSREFNEVEMYLMTLNPGIISMKDVEDNTEITVSGILEYTESKEGKEPTEIMAIITPEQTVYAFQSSTMKRSIHDISNIMKGKDFPIKKISGVTKAGRDYINCVLDVSKLK